MKKDIEERVVEEAKYILSKKCTVRAMTRTFKISKSTIHFDLSKRLKKINFSLFKEVDKLLKFNLSVRHIRGGSATQKKYRERQIYKNLK